MRQEEELELAIYRALRGEVPASVRRIIVTELGPKQIRFDVYYDGPSTQAWMRTFEEDVEGELQMCSPSGLTRDTLLTCNYRPNDPPTLEPGMLMVYDNPWAEWTSDHPVTDLAKR